MALALAGALAGDARAGAVIAAVEGTVEIGRGDPPLWRVAHAGDTLEPGQSLRVGAGGRAELSLRGSTVRLYESSLLRLPPDAPAEGNARAVELERGSGLFDVEPRRPGEGFEVRTPEAVVTVKGTRFAVDLAQGLASVAVFHGLVGVRAISETLEREVLVHPGTIAHGSGHGSFELRLESQGDPWDRWPSEQRTLPRVEESSADRALRESVRREVGTHLVRSDPRLRDAVAKQLAGGEARSDPKGEVPAAPDAVADTPADAPLEQVAEAFAEQTLNAGSTTGGGGLIPTVFDVEFTSQGSVIFYATNGTPVGTLTQSQLQQIVEQGQTGLFPPSVLQRLNANQTDPVDYAGQLQDLLKGP
jgi:hypothetical protein